MNDTTKIKHPFIEPEIENSGENYRTNFVVEEVDKNSPRIDNKLMVPHSLTILIITKGTLTLTFDQQSHIIGKRSVVRAIPEHQIFFNEASSDFKGKLIGINRNMLSITTTEFSPNAYLYIRQNPIFNISADELERILELFKIIRKKVNKIKTPSEIKVFHCLLMALYYELAGCIEERIVTKSSIKLSHKENLHKKFLILVQDNVRKHHTVSFYANQLCLTPQYISSVLKELSGMTANQWIDEMLLAEAKLLLFTTENNIQQIADELNFPDQSSFGKFFKKMTGVSPTNYKKMTSDQKS